MKGLLPTVTLYSVFIMVYLPVILCVLQAITLVLTLDLTIFTIVIRFITDYLDLVWLMTSLILRKIIPATFGTFIISGLQE